MNPYKIFGLLLFVLCVGNTTTCFAQEDPPPVAMPTNENRSLVDTLIKITGYEKYFREMCIGAVDGAAERQRWTEEKTMKIKGSIRFEYFSETIYNMFSSHTTDELLALIKKYKADVYCFRSNIIRDNWMVDSNLNLFLDSLIQGKYVMP